MRMRVKRAFERLNGARSGPDAPETDAETAELRMALAILLRDCGVKTIIDAPCRNWSWVRGEDRDGLRYIGIDVVEGEVRARQEDHGGDAAEFLHSDITEDALPKADLLVCRDYLSYLRYWLRFAALENFVASGTPYLLASSHRVAGNRNSRDNGEFAAIDLRAAPFGFPEPLREIDDAPQTRQQGVPAYLGLWHRDQVAAALEAQ